MTKTPKILFYGWLILALCSFGLIIARTIKFGWFQGSDWMLWFVFAVAIIMSYRRK